MWNCLERQKWIEELMTTHEKSFTFGDFIAISRDEGNGPNNSIWRTGGNSANIRTLSSFVVELPKEGPPVVFLRTANAEETIKSRKVILDAHFRETEKNGAKIHLENE